jgi:hypothetical protein
METLHYIDRRLSHDTDDGRKTIIQNDILAKGAPLIILGEAGMGKSTLLEWLAQQPGYSFCTASMLKRSKHPEKLIKDGEFLVIDALDEVSVKKDGDVVELILEKLDELNYPKFVISCRVADWRSATGISAISECYDQKPVELLLEPFNKDDCYTFLEQLHNPQIANVTINHFYERNLEELLSNPQTLKMIADIAGIGPLPEGKTELFERAVGKLIEEHNFKYSYDAVPYEVGLETAGALCAAMLITGTTMISLRPMPELDEPPLYFRQIEGVVGLQGIEKILGTRIFKSVGSDRFSYIHRRVAEYLAGKWLAKQADSPRKKRRLLSLLKHGELVPTSLRGLHAWLLHDPLMAEDIIRADPKGVVEYGDTDSLSISQARILLQCLKKLSDVDPWSYGWDRHTVKSFTHHGLIDDIRHLIFEEESVALTTLLCDSLKGSETSKALKQELLNLTLDANNFFSRRGSTAECVVIILDLDEKSELLRKLYIESTDTSLRILMIILDSSGYGSISNQFIADVLILCANMKRGVGVSTYLLERSIPKERIVDVLDKLLLFIFSNNNFELENTNYEYDENKQEFNDLIMNLISRALNDCGVTVEKFCDWLSRIDFKYIHGIGGNVENVNEFIFYNDEFRRAVQVRMLLINTVGKDFKGRWISLWRDFIALRPTEDDVVFLLNYVDESGKDGFEWKELLQLIYHDENEGSKARKFAKNFINSEKDSKWILALKEPPEWKAKQDEDNRQRLKKRKEKKRKVHAGYIENIEIMREGKCNALRYPALCYFGRLSGLKHDDVEPQDRIAAWLSSELNFSALEGFDQHLLKKLGQSAEKTIESHLIGSMSYSAYIDLAAINERVRNENSLIDVPDERLIVGLYDSYKILNFNRQQFYGLQEEIESELISRGLLIDAIFSYIESHLENNSNYISGLEKNLSSAGLFSAINCRIEGWFENYPELPDDMEDKLIHWLMNNGQYGKLLFIAKNKLNTGSCTRIDLWESINFSLQLAISKHDLSSETIIKKHVWSVQNYLLGDLLHSLSENQIYYLISSLRGFWPVVAFESGSGRQTKQDAMAVIQSLIQSLGARHSFESIAALEKIRDEIKDGYTFEIKKVLGELRRSIADASYESPSLESIKSVLEDNAPQSTLELQSYVIEELLEVQSKIDSNDIDSINNFYASASLGESIKGWKAEECWRDILIGILRQGSSEVLYEPETQVAAKRRVDITCSIGNARLPIEIKGQWHRELWKAADTQLEAYTQDNRAEGIGIYLVFWLGSYPENPNKKIQSPGRGINRPETSTEMKAMLIERSQAAKEGRVKIVVINLERENSNSGSL